MKKAISVLSHIGKKKWSEVATAENQKTKHMVDLSLPPKSEVPDDRYGPVGTKSTVP